MATKNVELLLVENVDNLGIVGDVVRVRLGYARNYLLPRGLASTPSEELLAGLKEKRAEAQKMLAELKAARTAMIEKLAGHAIKLVRSCNEQGILYGSVTQQDIANALAEEGFTIKAREVRIAETIKRLGQFEITVKFDAELEADVAVTVEPDRELDLDDDREEMEFDDEGNLIEKPKEAKPAPAEANAEGENAEAAEPAAG